MADRPVAKMWRMRLHSAGSLYCCMKNFQPTWNSCMYIGFSVQIVEHSHPQRPNSLCNNCVLMLLPTVGLRLFLSCVKIYFYSFPSERNFVMNIIEHVRLFGCLSASTSHLWNHMSELVTKFSVHVASEYDMWLEILFWRRCDTLFTSGLEWPRIFL